MRPRENVRVHWDEQCIAEHDKVWDAGHAGTLARSVAHVKRSMSRGQVNSIRLYSIESRPDTPFVRSPESSEDEVRQNEG